MFLGTMNLPASGETLALGDSALACCRQQLCPQVCSLLNTELEKLIKWTYPCN